MPDAPPTPPGDIPRAVDVRETTAKSFRTSNDGVTHERTWVVTMPGKGDGPVAAVLQPEIPRRFDLHPQDGFSVATEIEARELDDDEYTFTVTVRYESGQQEAEEEQDPNPLNRPIVYRFSSTAGEEIVAKDLDGKVIKSSSDEPLDVKRTTSTVDIIVTRNEPVFPLGTMLEFGNTINSQEFFSLPKRTVQLVTMGGESQVEGGILFFPVTYSFKYKRNGWNIKTLDVGTRKRNPDWNPTMPANQAWISLVDNAGYQFQGFTALDGNGQPLGPGAQEVFLPVGDDPWKLYAEKDFSVLNLEP